MAEPSRAAAVITMAYVEGWLSNDFPDASRYLLEHMDEIADQMVEDHCAEDPRYRPAASTGREADDA